MPLMWVPVGSSHSAAAAARGIVSSDAAPHSSQRFDFLQDLSALPVHHFVEKLKTAYVSDKGKAGSKFKTLTVQLTKALETSPAPGPCTFIVQCIKALVSSETPYAQGLGHLVTRSLDDLDESFKTAEDISSSKKLAAKLFKDAITAQLNVDERILVRLVLVFGVQISDVAEASGHEQFTKAVEVFILNLVKHRSYNCAVSLLKHLGLQEVTTQEFLVTMVCDGQHDLAGRWAEYLGKESCCFLVQKCTDLHLYKVAYRLVQRYDLQSEFPDAYQLYKRSSLRKLAGKGLWEIAESIASSDRVLQEYLVSLALGRKQANRAKLLCDTFQLDLDLSSVEFELVEDDTLFNCVQLVDVMELANVVWIDDAEAASLATTILCASQVVGFDCEWKPVRTKGTEAKISILQLATKERVYVLDLLTLCIEAPEEVNHCIQSIFSSSEIIKLGYAMHNDLEMLSSNYLDITSFRMLLDLQTFPVKGSTGGLSGLTKFTMGSYLDKSMRMSDWDKRPLSQEQLHYAALDAAILIPIHEKLCAVHNIVDSGRSCAYSFNLKRKAEIEAVSKPQEHPSLKNELQELAMAAGFSRPDYDTVTSGPGHSRKFSSTVRVGQKVFHGSSATKKKDSELLAAQQALDFFTSRKQDF